MVGNRKAVNRRSVPTANSPPAQHGAPRKRSTAASVVSPLAIFPPADGGEPKSSQPQIGPYQAVYRSLGLTSCGQFRKNHLVCAHSMKYWRDGNLSVLAASLLRSVSQWVLARLQRSTSQALLVKFKESLPFSKRQVWEAASLLASIRVKIQTGKLCVELRLVLGHIQVSARINPQVVRPGRWQCWVDLHTCQQPCLDMAAALVIIQRVNFAKKDLLLAASTGRIEVIEMLLACATPSNLHAV